MRFVFSRVIGHKDSHFYGAPFMGNSFMKSGFVSVVINYRKIAHPGGANDVAAAVKWVVDNIDNFKGDKDKLFLSGHSAGMHYFIIFISINFLSHLYFFSHY